MTDTVIIRDLRQMSAEDVVSMLVEDPSVWNDFAAALTRMEAATERAAEALGGVLELLDEGDAANAAIQAQVARNLLAPADLAAGVLPQQGAGT